MPNWCYNRIRIDADSDQVEKLKEIHDIFDKHSDPFNQILPIPDFKNIPNAKGELPKLRQELNKDGSVFYETYDFPDGKNDDRWYHWNIQNWGTKWDACHVEIEYYDDSQIEMRFDTAWSPPEPICKRLREMFEDIHISWFYDEPGMEIAGYL